MRVLLVKTSSMGDVIHTFPALTDAGQAIPTITFDWIVEDAFADIPKWHPLVRKVIPVALRRWRKGIFSTSTRLGWQRLRQQLKSEQYDLVLDAQGLIKSAFVSLFARGPRAGLDWRSAREAVASLAYQHKYQVNFYQHAVTRMRLLFSQALAYPLQTLPPRFDLLREPFAEAQTSSPYVVFLPGTTWVTKQWPEAYWIQLAEWIASAGYTIKMSGGNAEEMEKAKRFAAAVSAVEALPYLSITEMAKLLANAKAVVSVDTGFGHLAAALDVPTVSLYGPTNPAYTGALGQFSHHLSADFACAPCYSRSCTFKKASTVSPACFETISPIKVWETLSRLMQ